MSLALTAWGSKCAHCLPSTAPAQSPPKAALPPSGAQLPLPSTAFVLRSLRALLSTAPAQPPPNAALAPSGAHLPLLVAFLRLPAAACAALPLPPLPRVPATALPPPKAALPPSSAHLGWVLTTCIVSRCGLPREKRNVFLMPSFSSDRAEVWLRKGTNRGRRWQHQRSGASYYGR